MANGLLNQRKWLKEGDQNNNKSTSPEILFWVYGKKLGRILKTVGDSDERRTDSHITTICRCCKSFHKFWLLYLNSKSCYKSHLASKFLPEWLKSFKKCVLPLLGMELTVGEELLLFLHSIVLSFQEKRVIKILDLFLGQDSKEYLKLVSHMKMKRKTSLKESQILYSENLFFMVIVDRFMELVPYIDHSQEVKNTASEVLFKIQGNKLQKLSAPFHY